MPIPSVIAKTCTIHDRWLCEEITDEQAIKEFQDLVGPKEFCICAALKLPDGRVFNGHRHDGAIEYAGKTLHWEQRQSVGYSSDEIASYVRTYIADSVQGFTTSTGRFVDRYVGLELQKAAGKKNHARPDGSWSETGRELYSEELY